MVRDRLIIMTTTNGTKALARGAGAREVLVGCLLNAPSLADYLASQPGGDILLICAGVQGRIALEDIMGAGYLVYLLERRGLEVKGDGAFHAAEVYFMYRDDLAAAMGSFEHGRRLDRLWRDSLLRPAGLLAVPALEGASSGEMDRFGELVTVKEALQLLDDASEAQGGDRPWEVMPLECLGGLVFEVLPVDRPVCPSVVAMRCGRYLWASESCRSQAGREVPWAKGRKCRWAPASVSGSQPAACCPQRRWGGVRVRQELGMASWDHAGISPGKPPPGR